MGNFATQMANTVFVLMALLGGYYSIKWRLRGRLSTSSKKLALAWDFIYLAVFIRIGWWVLGLALAADHKTYHPFFVEWKWAATVPAAMLFTYGMIQFIQEVENLDKNQKAAIFFGVFGIAGVLSLL